MADHDQRTTVLPQDRHQLHESNSVIAAGAGRAQVVHHGIKENVRSSVTPAGTVVELGDEAQTRVIHKSPPAPGAFLAGVVAAQQAAPAPAAAPTSLEQLNAAKARHTALLKQGAAIKAETKALGSQIDELEDDVQQQRHDVSQLSEIQAEREALAKERSELAELAEVATVRASLQAEREAFEKEKADFDASQLALVEQNEALGSTQVQQTENLDPGKKAPAARGSSRGRKPGK